MTERLRIAVLSRNFSVTGGGAERYSISVVEQLAKQHEVHVFAQTISHDFPGVTYHQVPKPMERPRWINQLYFAWKTWRATRTGFDIIHSHENTWHGSVQTVHVLPVKHTLFAGKQGLALALRWLKVLTSPRLLAYLWLESMRLKPQKGKVIVVTSLVLKGIVSAAYPESEKSLRVVTPGIEIVRAPISVEAKKHARQSLGLPIDGPLVLFVGNDMQKKGLPTLIQAMQRLSELHLAVVGSGAHDVAMNTIALAKGVASRIHFLGKISDVNIAYDSADCLAHPTYEDTYAMVVLEAMARGLPVVVSGSRYCGISMELSDGQNAILIDDPADVKAWTDALENLILGKPLALELSAGGRAFAKSRTWEHAATKYENLMREVL